VETALEWERSVRYHWPMLSNPPVINVRSHHMFLAWETNICDDVYQREFL